MKISKSTMVVVAGAVSAFAGVAFADFTEGFEGAAPGWQIKNASAPVGATSWSITDGALTFPPHSGDFFASANYNNTGNLGTISTWLFSPVDTINNGDTFSFWTRTVDGSTYPDRLQVRLSANGASTDTGVGATGTGDFSILLADINPTLAIGGYPEGWTQYNLTVSGLGGPVSGRFAFRYFVEGAGLFGDNSNYIGIDDVAFTQIPAPSSLALLGMGLIAGGRRRR